MNYNHTQIGYLPIISLILLVLYFIGISIYSGEYIILIIGAFIIFIIFLLFRCLNVSINESQLKVKYGIGIFRKSFLLSEIKSVKQVKDRWYYGWGIRVWFWPKIWIYNISGYDAVEIVMYDGKVFRIGTGESEKLAEAIGMAIH